MRFPNLNITGGGSRILLFIMLILFGYVLAFFTAFAILQLTGYHQVLENLGNPDLKDVRMLNGLRIVQMTLQVGMFLVGPALYLLLVEQDPVQRLGMDQSPFRLSYGLIILMMIVCVPGINFMHTLNQGLQLPGWLSGTEKWMQQKENSANQLTEAFLSLRSYKDLAVNLIIFGFLPALGEELFFRGALFNIIRDWTRRKHLTVFITAFLFSAIHMQFYGFLPRFCMGVGFGYLFIFTGSLWAPILAHFLNNTMIVMVAYFYFQGKSTVNQDDFGTVDNLAVNLLSIAITVILFRVIYRLNRARE